MIFGKKDTYGLKYVACIKLSSDVPMKWTVLLLSLTHSLLLRHCRHQIHDSCVFTWIFHWLSAQHLLTCLTRNIPLLLPTVCHSTSASEAWAQSVHLLSLLLPTPKPHFLNFLQISTITAIWGGAWKANRIWQYIYGTVMRKSKNISWKVKHQLAEIFRPYFYAKSLHLQGAGGFSCMYWHSKSPPQHQWDSNLNKFKSKLSRNPSLPLEEEGSSSIYFTSQTDGLVLFSNTVSLHAEFLAESIIALPNQNIFTTVLHSWNEVLLLKSCFDLLLLLPNNSIFDSSVQSMSFLKARPLLWCSVTATVVSPLCAFWKENAFSRLFPGSRPIQDKFVLSLSDWRHLHFDTSSHPKSVMRFLDIFF